MSLDANRSAYVLSPYRFEVRDNPDGDPGPGHLLVRVSACGVCGTDLHIADRLANDWQPFGHEAAGTVLRVGAGVDRFEPGDRVALDSSAPCGRCDVCLPKPSGRGRPDLCEHGVSYWGTPTMGFGNLVIAPAECAVHVPEGMPFDVACLVEPVGVSIDITWTAEVGPGDDVLIVGPGPLGLGAVAVCRRAGASRVILAGRSHSVARMKSGEALGADELIYTDCTALESCDFGKRKPNKILVTAPPENLPAAIKLAPFGGVVAYIGIAYGPGSVISFDADDFHFRKLSLRASHAAPATHAQESIRLLQTMPELGRELVSHRFGLEEIGSAMMLARDDRQHVKKMVMVNGA